MCPVYRVHYAGIIQALETAGTDCAAKGIDAHTLALWDLEMLIANYNMRQKAAEDLRQGVTYEEYPKFRYEEYKAAADECKDLFEYGNWHYNPNTTSPEKTCALLDGRIMAYYEKFELNFGPALS